MSLKEKLLAFFEIKPKKEPFGVRLYCEKMDIVNAEEWVKTDSARLVIEYYACSPHRTMEELLADGGS